MNPSGPAAVAAVLTFLRSVGRRAEAQSYLEVFQRLPKESFAVIAVAREVAELSFGLVAEQLKFLAELGLYAGVFVGLEGGSSGDVVAQNVLRDLRAVGLSATPVGLEPDRSTVSAAAESLRRCLEQNVIPVGWFPAAADKEPQARQNSAGLLATAAYLGRLLDELKSRKLIVLRPSGALGRTSPELSRFARDHLISTHEEGISVIDLVTDRDVIRSAGMLSNEEIDVVDWAGQTIDAARGSELGSEARSQLVVNVTSPLNLLRELFTVKGAGTLIRAGTKILETTGYEGIDLARLGALLESSFGRRLRSEFFTRGPAEVYLEDRYLGVGIVERAHSTPLLTKFAVDRLAQGEGIGRDVWRAVRRRHPELVWRCRANNPAADWYSSLCDIMLRQGAWIVFGIGLELSQFASLVPEVLGRPDDFEQSTQC